MSEYMLGIDLGGTRIKAVAVTDDGEELERWSVETSDSLGFTVWRERVKSLAKNCRARWGAPGWIGLSAPGLAAADNRSIRFMPGRLDGLENFVWSDLLGAEVYVANDAHAALAGEAWLGAAAGRRNAFMLTLGTGVGGAILADGRILQGAFGRAGHLGHTCLDIDGTPDITRIPGSIEDLFGDCTIAARSAGRFQSTQELVAAYELGDEGAIQIWLRSVRALGCAIASLINILDPDVVVLGGGISQAGKSLFGPLQDVLDEVEWRPGCHRVELAAAALGDFAGALGIARLAHQSRSE
jgi:glucokinase